VKRLLLVLSFLLLSAAPSLADTVKSVYDGDTLTLSSGEKVRLACIDSPEMRNTAKKKADKPAAIAARDYLKTLIGTSEVKVQRLGKDLYGRIIARLYTPDGKELSQEMLKAGHAVVFEGYAKSCPWAKGGKPPLK
jgi:endonuclease YncB( thermonuclease family)